MTEVETMVMKRRGDPCRGMLVRERASRPANTESESRNVFYHSYLFYLFHALVLTAAIVGFRGEMTHEWRATPPGLKNGWRDKKVAA